MHNKYLLLLLFHFVTAVLAQDFSFIPLTTDHGLSQNDVNDILQDSRGYMWFATYDGLNKYDGYEFTVFQASQTNKNSICGNLIHSIEEGYDHDLWVTTENSGLSRIDLITDEIVNIKNTLNKPNVILTNRLGDLACFPKGNIWIETVKGINYIKYYPNGTYKVNEFEFPIQFIDNPEFVKLRSFARISDSSLWLIGHGGISTISFDENYTPTKDTTDIKFGNNFFECAIKGPEGYLLGMISGLYLLRYTDETKENYYIDKISDVVPTALCIDKYHNLWIGATNGVTLFSFNANNTVPYSFQKHYTTDNSNLTSNNIRCIYNDKTGILWFGTNGGGVCMLDQNKTNFRHYSLISDQYKQIHRIKFRSIYQDKRGDIWFGSDNHGLFYLPQSTEKGYKQTYYRYQPNKKNMWHGVYDITDVHTPKGDYLWAGCSFNNVLIELNPNKQNTNSFIKKIDDVTNMCFQVIQDSDSIVWIASYWGGLFRYNPYNDNAGFKHFQENNSGLPSNVVRNVLEDKQGRIWIGTSHGLCMLTNEEKSKDLPEFTVFQSDVNNPKSISHDYVLPIYQSSTDDIWIGTMGGGINQYIESDDPKGGHFISYTMANGLPNNIIKEILEDNEGNLWIASNKGLSCFNPTTLEIKNYDKSDGLQDNEFGELAGCKLKSGELLFGGVNGFNAFFPEEISEDTSLPNIAFTRLQIQGSDININDTLNDRIVLTQQLNETKHLKLKHNENNFSIHFSGMHYSSPLKNQYQYFLKGFDKKWNYTHANARFAKYTNLEPGIYTLKVIASNANNNWTPKAKEIRIVIQPPFWQTWIFRIAALMLFAITLFTIYKIRVRQLTRELTRRKEHEQILTLAKAKAEESDYLKSSIIANISHEIRTPVNGIFGFSELLGSENLNIDRRRRYIKIIRQKCRELIKLLDSVIMLSAAQTGSVTVRSDKRLLELSVNAAFATAHEKIEILEKPIDIKIIANEATLKQEIDTDHNKILVILNNLLDNAIKFTDKGKIQIGCEINRKLVRYSVSDTGIGISIQNKDVIFEDFRQSSTGLNREYDGIGLGLSLCKAYINMLDGDIWFESTENLGTTFYFTVPNILVE